MSSQPLFPGTAIVTGAASGIGRAVALSLAEEGCTQIALLDHDTTGLEEVMSLIGQKASVLAVGIDVSKEDTVKQVFDEIVQEWGRIDYAINCAGIIGPSAASHETSIADFDKVAAVNYRGLWLCSRAELGHMISQEPLPTHDGRPGNRGVVVNIASQLGLVGRPTSPAYIMSKSGVVGLTKADAIDYSSYNIRVNCVCPGVIDTPMTADIPDDSAAVGVAPMQRKGTPQEVADAVLFLCSSKASFIQGTALTVDGGYVIN